MYCLCTCTLCTCYELCIIITKMAERPTSALRDKAASIIGQYLLQGYRMLANHCPECGVSN